MTANTTGSRRPLRSHERPHLLNLGRLLRANRKGAEMTQAQLGLFAGLSRQQVTRIETGKTRTRRSTLTRLAAALVVQNPGVGSVERLVEDLVATAGPALAEESQYAERVARRRQQRTETKWRADLKADELGMLRMLYDLERSEYWFWRSQEEKDEMRAEYWELFYARRGEMERSRREVEGMTRGRGR